jgi:hypothetical protein
MRKKSIQSNSVASLLERKVGANSVRKASIKSGQAFWRKKEDKNRSLLLIMPLRASSMLQERVGDPSTKGPSIQT